jgi:hypothetical protein
MSRILGKFIQDLTISDAKILLRNNLPLLARNAGDSANIGLIKLNTSDVAELLTLLNAGGFQIKNIADGTDPQDAVSFAQLQSTVSGLTDPKDSTRAATTADLPASTYANGTNGDGATLTADANGALAAQDGVSLSVGDRLLVKDQTAGLENGIYEVTALGDAGNPWVLTRTADANQGSAVNPSGSDIVSQGMFVPVAEGINNGGRGFLLTTQDPISLGVTALNFIQFGEVIQAGAGLTKSGNTLSIDNGDGLGFNGNQLVVLVDDDAVDGTTKIATGAVVGRRRFEESFTLNATDISNGYVDLTKVASRDSVLLFPRFGIKQKEVVDFTVSYLGGAGGKTRVTFAGDLGSIIADGDVLDINFESLDY